MFHSQRKIDLVRRLGLVTVIILGLILFSAPLGTGSKQQTTGFIDSECQSKQYVGSGNIAIENNQELVEIATSGVGTRNDPYVISNLQIKSSAPAIRVSGTTAFFVIRDCDLGTTSASTAAVVLFSFVEHGSIENCFLTGATNGIQFMWSDDCRVVGCYSQGNAGNGVYVYQSTDCEITDCKLYANYKGIMFEGSTYCRVENNSIYRNTFVGVEFEPYSYNNTVLRNEFGWNFVRNGIETHARDSGLDNRFDDGIGVGNAYSDYNESEPYLIAGDSGSIDNFAAFFDDPVRPTVDPVHDFAFDIESNGNFIEWAANDSYPFTYTVLINSFSWKSGAWTGGEISVLLDTIAPGTHNLTLIVTDAGGNTENDSVSVTAVSFVFGGMGTELVMIASGITVLSFVLLLVVIKRMY